MPPAASAAAPDALAGRDEMLFGSLLSFAAGFVDTAAFVSLFGLFTAHVTGNFVLIGQELVTASTGVLAKLLALPAFVLAVAATRLFAIALERRGVAPLRWLLAFEAVLLIVFCAVGVAGAPFASADEPLAITAGMLGVVAMGIQNALARLSLAHLAQTTVMTGNVTQAVIDTVDLLRGAIPAGSPARGRMRRMLPAVVAFAAGAIAGAYGVAGLSFWCLLVPAALIAGLAARA